MPQLDLTIIFPQIFWLCVLFSFFYYILVCYLLPKFILALKLRVFIYNENTKKSTLLSENLTKTKNNKKIALQNQISALTINFIKLEATLKKFDEINLPSVNSLFFKSTVNSLLLCDYSVLKSIHFHSKIL